MLRKKRILTIKLMAAQADSVYTRYIENGKRTQIMSVAQNTGFVA